MSKIKMTFLAVVLLLAFGNRANAGEGGGCTIGGSQDAALTIEEFVDFECPFCVRGANTMKQILKEYKGRVRLVLRHTPLPMHTQALNAAKAFTAVCLQSPARASWFQQELFAGQERLKREGTAFLLEVAENIGVDVVRMQADMTGSEVARILQEDKRQAERHGFTGVPSFLIGKEPLQGAYPYADFKKIVDRQLGE